MGIEEILKEKGICVTKTLGNSMNPMLIEGRDRVIIEPPRFPLKKYDVPIYRRDGHYTMHRIIKVTKNSKYIICGDNRINKEYDITDKDIIGVLTGYYKGTEYVSCNDKNYIRYAKKICRNYYFRSFKHKVKKLFTKI